MHAEQLHNTETTEHDLIQERVSDTLTDFFILVREKLAQHLASLSVGQILPHEKDLVESVCINLAADTTLSEEKLRAALHELLKTIQDDRIYFGPTWITTFSHTEFDRAHNHFVSLRFPDPSYSGLMEMTIRQGQFQENAVVVRVSEFAVSIPTALTTKQLKILAERGFAPSVLDSATCNANPDHEWYSFPHQDAPAIITYLEESLDENLVHTPVLVQPAYLADKAIPLDKESLADQILSKEVFSDLLHKYPDLLQHIKDIVSAIDSSHAADQSGRVTERVKAVLSHFDIVIFTSIIAVVSADFFDASQLIEKNSDVLLVVYFLAMLYFFVQYSIQAHQADQLRERNAHLIRQLAERESDDFFDDDDYDDFDAPTKGDD